MLDPPIGPQPIIAMFRVSDGAGRCPRDLPTVNVPHPEQTAAKALIPRNPFLETVISFSLYRINRKGS
jgi:hypothetical protein